LPAARTSCIAAAVDLGSNPGPGRCRSFPDLEPNRHGHRRIERITLSRLAARQAHLRLIWKCSGRGLLALAKSRRWQGSCPSQRGSSAEPSDRILELDGLVELRNWVAKGRISRKRFPNGAPQDFKRRSSYVERRERKSSSQMSAAQSHGAEAELTQEAAASSPLVRLRAVL
jgi:hypothetical protein